MIHFEKKAHIQLLHEKMWEAFGGVHRRGTTFSTDEVETVVGIPRDSNTFRHIRSHYRRRMRKECGVMVDWEHGNRVHRILTDKEQNDSGAEKLARGVERRNNVLISVINGVNLANLSAHECRLNQVRKEQAKRVKRTIIQARNGVVFVRKTEVNPQRPMPA